MKRNGSSFSRGDRIINSCWVKTLHCSHLSTVSRWVTETRAWVQKCHGGLVMKNVLFLAAGITTSARPKTEMLQRDGWNLFWRFALTSPPSVFLRTVYAELSVHQKPPKIRFSQDPGSNWFIIFCSVQAWRALPMFGKSTKLSQRTKQGRFMVFRFGCWLKEHEANRLPGYAEAQICVGQGVQECPCWISRDV